MEVCRWTGSDKDEVFTTQWEFELGPLYVTNWEKPCARAAGSFFLELFVSIYRFCAAKIYDHPSFSFLCCTVWCSLSAEAVNKQQMIFFPVRQAIIFGRPSWPSFTVDANTLHQFKGWHKGNLLSTEDADSRTSHFLPHISFIFPDMWHSVGVTTLQYTTGQHVIRRCSI